MSGQKFDGDKLPVGVVIQRQFPNALKAVAQASNYGHKKYEESDKDFLNCFRVEGGEERYLNAAMRHLLDSGEDLRAVDESGLPHINHVVWNFLVLLEIIEKEKNDSI